MVFICIYDVKLMNSTYIQYNLFYVMYMNSLGMHDGKISVYSAGEGMGSSFTVEIEMQRKARRPPPNSDNDHVQGQTAPSSQRHPEINNDKILQDKKLHSDKYLNNENKSDYCDESKASEANRSIDINSYRSKSIDITSYRSNSRQSISHRSDNSSNGQNMYPEELISNNRAENIVRLGPAVKTESFHILIVDDSGLNRYILVIFVYFSILSYSDISASNILLLCCFVHFFYICLYS
jgi:hypothetical protein